MHNTLGRWIWLGFGVGFAIQGKLTEALGCFILSEIHQDRIDNSKEV